MPNCEIFFNLTRYAHRALWKAEDPAWGPLHFLMEYLRKKAHTTAQTPVPRGVFFDRPETILIGEGTILEPGVYIQGPCILGKNCIVRHGAYLRDGVICGDGCVIGHSAEIKHSILFDFVHATHFTYVGDSILGNAVNLGAGVKCANLRLDRREVRIEFEGHSYNTGLKKMGAILGDHAQIGCNCVLNPGTLMGKESSSHPLLNLGGFIPARGQVKAGRPWTLEGKEVVISEKE